MKLQAIFQNDSRCTFDAAAQDRELGTQVQAILIVDGLLNPPADGAIGPITRGAIASFQKIVGLPQNDYFDRALAKKLIETRSSAIPQALKAPKPDVFDEAFHLVLQYEGGLCDDSAEGDPGGLTNLGLCKYDGLTDQQIRALTPATAAPIYREKYWDRIQGDKLAALSRRIAIAVFDFEVNAGVRGAEDLQQCENDYRRDYHGTKALQATIQVAVDGGIGPETLSVLSLELSADGAEARILIDYFRIREACYHRWADAGQGAFLEGWLSRCHQLAAHLQVDY